MGLSPPIFVVLTLATFFGSLATILMLVSVATDHWEYTSWDADKLRNLPTIDLNLSVFKEDDKLYKIVVTDSGSINGTQTHYIRSTYGGIWRICDYVTDNLRQTEFFSSALQEAPWLTYHCFSYIPEFTERRAEMEANGYTLSDPTREELFQMQNSTASSVIVSMMCLLSAAIIGVIGVWQKQVSACMVTGVMFSVAGVFLCFALVVKLYKLSYMRSPNCYSLDPLYDTTLCDCRTVSIGWSVPLAWVSFAMFMVAFVFWLLVSRYVRIERAKSMM